MQAEALLHVWLHIHMFLKPCQMLTFLVRYIVVIIQHVNTFFTVIPGRVLIISVSGAHGVTRPLAK